MMIEGATNTRPLKQMAIDCYKMACLFLLAAPVTAAFLAAMGDQLPGWALVGAFLLGLVIGGISLAAAILSWVVMRSVSQLEFELPYSAAYGLLRLALKMKQSVIALLFIYFIGVVMPAFAFIGGLF